MEMNTTISRMRIWTVGVVFLCYLFVSIGGQLQASLKRISGDTTSKQDGNIKQVSLSTFRLEHDNGYHESIAQQSFALIAEDETTRRLGTMQVMFFYFFFRILAFCYCFILDCIFCVGHDHLRTLFNFYSHEFNELFHPPLIVGDNCSEHHNHHCRHGDLWKYW